MELKEKAAKYLESKHILLDTNVIKLFSGEKKEIALLDEKLRKLNCIYVINDLIKFEFLRDSNTYEVALDKKRLVKETVVMSMPNKSVDLMTYALAISNIYAHNRISTGRGLGDLMISAFLYKHKNDLVLLTENQKHFPPLVHDVVDTVSIEVNKGKARKLLTLIRFNPEKFNDCLEAFYKTREESV